jgi:tape measure domain-containing protein
MAETNSIVFKLDANIGEFNKKFDDIKKRTENISDTLESVGRKAGIAFAALSASVAGFVHTAGKIDDVEGKFETLLGSTEAAKGAIKELSDFLSKAPFGFDEVAAAEKKLLSFGLTVGETKTRLQEIGDVSAASGAQLETVSEVFGKISSTGKVTIGALVKLQQEGIPIFQALADSAGKTDNQIREMATKGTISLGQFEKAFSSLSKEGGFAFQAMQKESQGLDGRLQVLKNNFVLLSGQIGAVFLPVVNKIVGAMSALIDSFRQNEEIAKITAYTIAFGVAITGVVTALSVAGQALLFFQTGMAALGGTFTVLGTVVGAILSPIGLFVAAIAAGTAAIIYFKDNIAAFATAVAPVFSGLGNIIAGAFTGNVERVAEGVQQMKSVTLAGIDETYNAILEKKKSQDERMIASDKDYLNQKSALRQQDVDFADQKAAEEAAKAQQKRDEEKTQLQLHQEYKQALLEQEEQLKIAIEEAEQLRGQTGRDEEVAALQDSLDQELEMNYAKQNSLVESEKVSQEQIAEIHKQNSDTIVKLKKAETTDTQKSIAALTKFDTDNQQFRLQQTQSTLQYISSAQNSQSRSLFEVAKAAAIANAIITGIQAVQNALASVPYPFNFAAAGVVAAVAASNVAQISKTQFQGAADGALVEGGTKGVDSVPFMLEPGELVVPRRNFDEVISAVVAARTGSANTGAPSAAESVINNFNITVSGVIGEFTDRSKIALADAVADAVIFGNANTRGVFNG